MAVILAARRTAVVPRGGAFARMSLEALAAPVIAAVLADAGLPRGAVDEVIAANALGAGGNPARRVALAAGLPERVAGLTIDRQCAGGLDAILLARALVDSGAARIVLAGGVESYSRRPLRLITDPDGGPPVPYDQPPFTPWPDRDPEMTEAAAALAERLGLSRAAQEAWAAVSHARTLAVVPPGIVPLSGQARDPFARVLRPGLLARAPVLAGNVTAATAAVAADSAAFVLVVADAMARPGALRLGPPVPAIRAVLQAAGLRPADLAQVELMEAYAAQAMACQQGALEGLDPARINPAGGALARGHPIGASGLRMAYEVYNQLLGRAGERQLPSPSIGLTHNLGGVPYQGIAAISILGLA